MTRFEYKVVPAPNRGLKAKGVKRAEDRFALALSTLMNELGAEGWDYVRADILPTEERSGLASKQTVYHNMLVFRRILEEPAEDTDSPALEEAEEPLALAAPDDEEALWDDPPEVPLEQTAAAEEAGPEDQRREAAAE
ncbi:DUF4177 domain-containing protein [Nioella ostreopsis]|uniref:DUF4177 domain-containing protein n=1 Tax=Nioella ostreopsis TaxID=2448479 RepID=UPI0019805460|nr:DUF4177 domain-containing protein [Nioella ostreopsis]